MHFRPLRLLIFTIILCMMMFFGCRSNTREVERACYFWKSNQYWFSDREDTLLNTLGISKMYVKYFEVQAHPTLGNAPMSKTSFNLFQIRNKKIELVPVVFISNEVLKKNTQGAMDTLADNIVFLARKYSSTYQSPNSWNDVVEMQIDCDWTPSTKENYFYLLKQIKALSKLKISCTLRLYPYAYPDKMGVPPVDKVMLMCYNLLPPLESRDKNSILDLDELQAYLKKAKKYPVDMDVALPVFSWMHHYSNNQFKSLINRNPEPYSSILSNPGALWSEVTTDSLIGDVYFRAGDRIKTERVEIETLMKATQMIRKHVRSGKKITVSLFHFDEEQLNQYRYADLDALYAAFGR
jgi:hypothetical protein